MWGLVGWTLEQHSGQRWANLFTRGPQWVTKLDKGAVEAADEWSVLETHLIEEENSSIM